MYRYALIIACALSLLLLVAYQWQQSRCSLYGTWYVPFQFAKHYGLYSYVMKLAPDGSGHVLLVNQSKTNMISEPIRFQLVQDCIQVQSKHPHLNKLYANPLKYTLVKKNNLQFMTLHNDKQVIGNFVKAPS